MSHPVETGVAAACRFQFDFGAAALRQGDPLPAVLEFLASQPALAEQRQQLYLVLSELFYNALDHGVLGIDSAVKETEDGFIRFYEIRDERRAALQDGSIRIDVEYRPVGSGGEIAFTIIDSGQGFDFENREFPDFDDNEGSCGRGVPLVRSLCRDFRFVAPGNRVEAVYVWS